MKTIRYLAIAIGIVFASNIVLHVLWGHVIFGTLMWMVGSGLNLVIGGVAGYSLGRYAGHAKHREIKARNQNYLP